MPKRSPEDILADIESSEHEEAADRALSMTPAEREKELEAAGVTAAELDAKADEWRARMERATVDEGRKKAEAEARVVAMRPPARRWPLLLAAALAVGALAVFVWLQGEPKPAPGPTAVPSAPPSATIAPAASPSTRQLGPPDASPEAQPTDDTPISPVKPPHP